MENEGGAMTNDDLIRKAYGQTPLSSLPEYFYKRMPPDRYVLGGVACAGDWVSSCGRFHAHQPGKRYGWYAWQKVGVNDKTGDVKWRMAPKWVFKDVAEVEEWYTNLPPVFRDNPVIR